MTMSVTYGTFLGQTVHEVRGGVERVYVPDTLGSTHKLTDASGAVTDSFDYWPYGEERVRTGSTATPFTFVGTLGYYKDQAGRLYVRARHLLTRYARWLTLDPLWPDESAYGYAVGDPTVLPDESGMSPCQGTGQEEGAIGAWEHAERTRQWLWERDHPRPRRGTPPVYGKFCGPQSNNPKGGPIADKGTDRCCYQHDKCWAKFGCTFGNQLSKSKEVCRTCTSILCNCLSSVKGASGPEGAWNLVFRDVYCHWPFKLMGDWTKWPTFR